MRSDRIGRGMLVIVDWLDAVADHEWQEAGEAKPERVRSVGIIVATGRDGTLKLAADYGPRKYKDDVNRVITIPGGMVKRVRAVRLGDCKELHR